MNQEIIDTFSTKDLHFAAFLNISGVELLTLESHSTYSNNRNPIYFIFKDKQRCEALEGIFWSGEGEEIMINAKMYVDTIRALRARISSVNNFIDN